ARAARQAARLRTHREAAEPRIRARITTVRRAIEGRQPRRSDADRVPYSAACREPRKRSPPDQGRDLPPRHEAAPPRAPVAVAQEAPRGCRRARGREDRRGRRTTGAFLLRRASQRGRHYRALPTVPTRRAR